MQLNHSEPFPRVGSTCVCVLDQYHVKVFVVRQQVGADSLLSADVNLGYPPLADSQR